MSKEHNHQPQSLEAQLHERYFTFPDLTFAQYERLPRELQEKIILHHPLLSTDAYNRTMEYLSGTEKGKDAIYSLQLRRAPYGYHIVAGINRLVDHLARITITPAQIEFAKQFYQNIKGVNHFDSRSFDQIATKGGKLPLSIKALPDGSIALPGEPILTVTGPSEAIARFETYFHRVFYSTAVATNACQIARFIEPSRFIEVGLRGTLSDELHLIAGEASYIGGGIFQTSNDALAGLYPFMRSVGTIGHRYVQSFASEEEAFVQAIEKLDRVSLLIDTYEPMQGIELAVRLKKTYRTTGKNISIRLDSGDLATQCLHALRLLASENMLNSSLDKIIVEGVESLEEYLLIEQTVNRAGYPAKDFLMLGAGHLLVAQHVNRRSQSSGFKITSCDGVPSMKFAGGKRSFPGNPTIYQNGERRIIAQSGEYHSQELLIPQLIAGKKIFQHDLAQSRQHARRQTQHLTTLLSSENLVSPDTRRLISQLSKGGEKI